MKRTTPIASLMADADVMDEIRGRVTNDESLPRSDAFRVRPATIRSVIVGGTPESFETRPLTEAIVRQFGRPALLVKNDTFEMPASGTWRTRLLPNKSKIDRALRSVGRVELFGHPDFEWVGTAWVIAENVVVTNRHVAMEFARSSGSGFAFAKSPFGGKMGASIDFKEEHQQSAAAFEVKVNKILLVEKMGDTDPDLAILQLKTQAQLPPPIKLSSRNGRAQQLVAVVGYPARDDRNASDAMFQVFGDIYEVKRLAPGMIMEPSAEPNVFTHDCSTLGGNSGSLVLDVESGEAVGLHFAGQFKQANFAVKPDVLLKTLRRLKITVPVTTPGGGGGGTGATTTPATQPSGLEDGQTFGTIADFESREGYQDDFLGTTNALKVPLPKLSHNVAQSVAPLIGKPQEHVLKYTHFSVVMHKERRFAIYTVSNIDGMQLRHIPRDGDKWFFDPRLRKNHQIGEGLYRSNDLDRGHLVRRLDPVWGTEAEVANEDTFFFTNCTPQHKDFNQKTWLGLEEHILDSAGAHRLRLSVFTGPVYRSDDREYRGVKLPQQYWKVVVMVKDAATAAARKLSATAYMLSQAQMLTTLEAGFTFGQFKTYQVPVTKVEELTGIDFGDLRTHDPLKPQERVRRAERIRRGRETNMRGEALRPEEGFGFRELDSLADIVV